MSENNEQQAPVGDAEAQVQEIFENLTPEQMALNDIDTATTARECRKIAHGLMHSVCPVLDGRSGMTDAEKVEALQIARDRALLMITALNRGIDLALAKQKENDQ